MIDSSSTVIEQSIEQLEKLSTLLAGDVPSNSNSARALPHGVRLSKESLLTISVLLPKLRAIREAHQTPYVEMRICPDCDD